MVEFVTKLVVDKIITSFNTFQDATQADRIKLFFQVLSTILYAISLLISLTDRMTIPLETGAPNSFKISLA